MWCQRCNTCKWRINAHVIFREFANLCFDELFSFLQVPKSVCLQSLARRSFRNVFSPNNRNICGIENRKRVSHLLTFSFWIGIRNLQKISWKKVRVTTQCGNKKKSCATCRFYSEVWILILGDFVVLRYRKF